MLFTPAGVCFDNYFIISRQNIIQLTGDLHKER